MLIRENTEPYEAGNNNQETPIIQEHPLQRGAKRVLNILLTCSFQHGGSYSQDKILVQIWLAESAYKSAIPPNRK